MDWRNQARPFFNDPECWALTLIGGYGSGKSCFAAAIQFYRMLKAMVANGIPMDAETIPYSVRGDWRNGDDLAASMRQLASWPAIKAQIVASPFLVIDDLGAARMTAHVKTETSSILMTRHREQRKTILTTNMSLRDMADEIDGRIESRLHDGIVIHTGEEDLRKR